MFKKRCVFVLVLLIFTIAALSAVSASDLNTTDEVISEEVSIDAELEQTEDVILEASGNTFNDLYKKISSSGSTVTLDQDYYCNYYTDRDFLQGIEINGVLTIYGNGHTIYANGARTFIFGENADVIIDGVNFVNNNDCNWLGGGTIVNLGKLTLKNCEFTNSSAVSGGAVFSLNELIIVSCRFTHNRVYDYDKDLSCGGAISAAGSLLIYDSYFTQNGAEYNGGAIFSECGSSSIVNCSFVNNFAGINGGAIDNKHNMSISNSSFINNSASNNGGAIYSVDSINVYSCDFSKNCVNWSGAGIFSNGTCYVVYSNFIDNSAEYAGAICSITKSIIENSSFVNNSAVIYGSSILNDGNMSIYSSSFINNSGYDAGTIFNLGNMSIYSSNFTENYANISGGAIYSNGICYVADSEFIGNTAKFAGAIFSENECFIVNSTFVNNSASYGGAIDSYEDMGIYSSSFIDNSAGYDGGAVYGWGAFAVDCSFIDNSADGEGGAMYGASAVNCSFVNNSADNGGAMYEGSAYSSSFTDNHANTDGGAVYDVFAVNCLFEYNSAENGGAMSKGKATDCTFNYNNATAYGGAIYSAKVSTSSKFKNNYALNGKDTYNVTWFDKKNIKSFMDLNELINSNNDTDIYLNDNYTFDLATDLSFKDGISISRVVTIHGNGFTIDGDNFASIFSVSNTGVVFRDIVFVNGKSQRGGGAIYCSGSGTVVNCSFVNNSADNGGAIYLEGESFDVVNCTFIYNAAINDGGAVFVKDGEFKVVHTNFINNSARGLGQHFGGAMYGGYAEDCVFADNVVGQFGGAMYEGSAVNCTFINNSAISGSAGAIGNGSAVNCIFINNSAGDYVGGALDGGSAVNCSFIDNSARYGGAMYEGSAVSCSFVSNSAEYGGAMYEGSAVSCSFVSNSADWGGAIYYSSSVVNCSFIDNSAEYGGAIYDAGSVVNCSFTENSANYSGGAAFYGSFINCIFTRNSAYEGGAIANFKDFVIECTFIENSANVGGAIYSFSGESNIVNCNFTRNSALWEAGAVFSVDCVNCSFTENYADYGGAIKYGCANNCIFIGNYAIFGGASYESASLNCRFIENYADYGGAICAGFTIENCSFIKNFADFGGAMYYSRTAVDCRFINNTARNGGATYEVGAENCYFKDNEATENGGAMYGESATDCIFKDNKANIHGNDTYNTIIPNYSHDDNIIYFDASAAQDGDGSESNPYKYLYPSRLTPRVTAFFADGTYDLNGTCIIEGAKLIGNGPDVVIKSRVSDQYDFIVNENSYLEFYHIHLINANILNHATLLAASSSFEGNDVFDLNNLPEMESGSGLFDSSYGGVIVCDGPSNIRPTLFLDGCLFDGVYDAFNGGVIAAINTDISILNTTFILYSATYKGGAIYCVNSNLNIHDSEFTPFTVSSDDDSTVGRYKDYTAYYGGSIYCENSDMFISKSKFNGSVSSSFGGCIASLNSHMSIEETNFYNSLSLIDGGGAIYISKSKIFITDSIFESNSAEFGGAICNINSILDSYYSSYRNNSAKYYGGAIYDIYGNLNFFRNMFNVSHALVGGSIYTRITNSFNLHGNNFNDSYAQEGSVVFFDGKKEDLASYFNSFGNNYHLFVEFRATLNGEDYYMISNPLFYQLSSETDSDLYLPYPIFEVNDGRVSIVIYDSDDASNLTSIATGNVIRNVSAKVCFSEEFSNPVLNFYLLEDINTGVFFDRKDDTKVYSKSRNQLFDDYNLIKTYSIDLSDKVITNNYNFTEFWAIDFSIKSGNLYEDNSYYPVSLINGSIIDSSSTPSSVGVIPSYYSSNDYGLVSSVKDQKNGGNCWAFAGLATLETCLKKATGVTYDFSEENAKNLMAAYSVYGVKIESNFGGYDSMMMSYLTSWLGPIDESAEGYDDYSSISVLKNPMFHIQNIKFLPARSDSSDNDLYKLAIMDYGAVSIIFKWGNDYHAISLVGWDDDYKGYDVVGNKANGAWIFKNSFGEDWQNNGFGYLSYSQKISEQIDPSLHAYTFIFNDADSYDKIYQYDFAGVSQFYHYSDSIYFKNTFTAEENSLLSAFSTYFDAQTDYAVSVYVNDQFVFAQNGTSSAGYYTIRFNNFIQLDKGDKFTIAVHNHNANGYSCIPLCYAEEITKKTFSSNVSFVSLDGETWYDLYNYADSCHVACIKAFTQNIDSKRIKINANDVRIVNTRNFNVKVSFDDFGDISSINYCLLKFTVDGKNYYAQIKNGVACLNLKLDDGIHCLSAQYKDNVFESNVIQFNFTVDASKESYSFNAIQDIVDRASDKSVIVLDSDYVYDEYLDDGDYGVHIDKQITINGNGHVLDGLNKATAFYIDSDNVVLNDIVFVNMFAINGGGVFVAGRNVTLNNCIFINSSAEQFGGAIYSLFDINLNNCQFINDSANIGGGLYLMSTETSRIINSCFENNSANAYGSAVYMDGIGKVLVSSSNFTSNAASYNGGAVFSGVYSNNFTDCNFVDNNANSGGAVFSNARINEFVNCNFVNNSAKESGGAISAHYKINVYDSDFINNSVTEISALSDDFGGFGGGAIISYDDLNIYDSNFINNHVVTYGGAIYANRYLNIYKSTFVNNSASYSGGAIYNTPSKLIKNDISEPIIIRAVVTLFTESNYYDSTFIGNHAEIGGAIYNSGLVENCTFINNSASYSGGAIVNVEKLDIFGSGFIDNSARYGGAIDNDGNMSVYSSDFTMNCADGSGGAIYSGGNCNVVDCDFADNSANWCGAIILKAEGIIINSSFVNNSAHDDFGGAIGNDGNMSIYSSNFTKNCAGGSGASIYSRGTGYLVDCDFADNSAGDYGGAIENIGNLNISSSSFADNSARYGGAIDNDGNMKVCSSNFTKNCAEITGGAIYSKGNCCAVDCDFADNSANWGGAMYKGSAVNCSFTNNSAGSYGGAMYYGSADWCYFQDNVAALDGEDIYNTEILTVLNVPDFVSYYKSGDRLIVNLSYSNGVPIEDADVTISVYKDGALVGNYYCLSGDGWVVDLEAGDYVAVVCVDSHYLVDPVYADISVVKFKTNIAVEDTYVEYGGDATLVATLINNATGQAIKGANVKFTVNGEKYSVKTDANGQAKLTVSGLTPDTYKGTVSYGGNGKYNSSSASAVVVVSKIATSVSLYYDKTTGELVATLINSGSGKGISGANVVFNLNGVKTAVKTNKLGEARLSIGDVDPDNFNAGISYGGNSKYLKSTGSIRIAEGKIPTGVSNSYNRETGEVIATLINADTGIAIKGATVVFNINGVKTALKTDKLGQVKLSVADLSLGVNSIGSSYGGNFKYSGSTTSINIVKI